jgi:DNA-binding GntR family transcriptional regulator
MFSSESTARLVPVRASRTSLADAAYDALLEGLTSTRLHPGDRLVMDVIAEELGISRTPVRDALQRLEREGLIVAAEKRGYIVRSLDQSMVRHLYEGREAVEGFAARKLALNGPASVLLLERSLQHAVSLDDGTPKGSYEANRFLHRAIVELTENPVLLTMFDDVWGKSTALLTYSALYDGETVERDKHDLRAEHGELLASIRSGKPARAEQAAIAHIRDGLERNLRVLGASGD